MAATPALLSGGSVPILGSSTELAIRSVSLHTCTQQANGRRRGRRNSSTTVSPGLNCQEL